MTQLRFDGQVIAITGAGQNMGREYALFLATRGARLVVNDIKGAPEVIAEVKALGGDVIENRCDVATSDGCNRIVQDALDRWGRIDAIINNAAVYGPSFSDAARTGLILAVHLTGTINLIRAALPSFRRQSYGRILNIGSGSIFGIANTAIYASAKGGVFALTRGLARDFVREGIDIKINCLLPVAFPSGAFTVPDEPTMAALSTMVPPNVAPVAAVLLHSQCPCQGEAIQAGGVQISRVVLSTTKGWCATGEQTSPEEILDNWTQIVAKEDLREPMGSLSDLLMRRGLPAYSATDIIEWSRSGIRPPAPPEETFD